MKNNLARAKTALPNGYCTLPLQQSCEYANACLGCPVFVTTAEFLPQHHRQLTQTRTLIEQAEQAGQQRVVEMNRGVEQNLLAIITGLDTPSGCASNCSSRAPARPRPPSPGRPTLIPAEHADRLAEHARARHEQTLHQAHTALTSMASNRDAITVSLLASKAGIGVPRVSRTVDTIDPGDSHQRSILDPWLGRGYARKSEDR